MIRKMYFDLGNSNFKGIIGDKKIISSSNVERVEAGTFGSFEIDGKYYIIGECARSKKCTNKIVEEKRALLGRELFTLLEDKEKVEISVLLPLSLYVNIENKTKYIELLKGKYNVTNPNGVKKTFTVSNVEVCAETYSSLITQKNLAKDPLYLVDIGGVDTTGCLVHKIPNSNKMFTNECGMNIYYAGLAKVLTARLLESYNDKDAELLFNKYNTLPDDIKQEIDRFTEEYISKNIYSSLKEIGYKPLIHKLVFCGGGSIALSRYLSKDSNATILENALYSNVEGAKIISTRRNK